ncbi:hypothetical protein [Reinekea sp.]|jgi:hypothetical protein|uniref:hypothetical protein n=1 Tax=Reinekea sp. TaxID=1970455 RepID=UPI0039893F4C
MSTVESIALITDSASYISGLPNAANIHLKQGEVIWNDMQCEDPPDGYARQLFFQNAEVNERTSGLIKNSKFNWADSLAEHSIEQDALFMFAPHQDIFPQQLEEMINAQVRQKTQYIEFFSRHKIKTGKLKTFIIKTESWFTGTGLIVWQCQHLLSKIETDKSVPLTQLKRYFEQITARTRTVSIMPCNQLNPWTRSQIIEESMLSKLRGNMGRTKWISIELGIDITEVSQRDSLEVQVESQLKNVIEAIKAKKLAFPRIVISCSDAQLATLKSMASFTIFDALQSSHKFKWLHQPSSIMAQVLTGKDAVHISYSVK